MLFKINKLYNEQSKINFMKESNLIEGENRLNPGDIEAIDYALKGVGNMQDILNLHLILGKYLKKDWVGRFRKVDVVVGSYKPPRHPYVFDLMDDYCKRLLKMDSWFAHNEFELIHPFQDLNGRVGRLIWLSKATEEGYNFRIPFLRMYYYQTLNIFVENNNNLKCKK